MAVNKVVYGNQTLIDISDTTAVASDVMAGKYFYGNDGVKTAGTGTGGGSVTQDQDGYIVLPSTGGGSSGYSIEDIITATGISGAIRITEATSTIQYALANRSNITSVYCDSITSLPSYWLRSCTGLITLVLPNTTSIAQQFVSGCKALKTIDFGKIGSLGSNLFYTNTSSLDTLILRKSNSIVTLSNVSAFTGTPFVSGGSGGTIYIPKALYDHLGDGTSLDYKAATNWSTVNGYGTITWAKIEGSQYENYYADGTEITS